jgi:hypothetical protein
MVMAAGATGTQACAMQSIPHPTPDRHLGRLVWGTLAGASLVAVGLSLAFLVITTPLVTQLVPGSRSGSSQLTLAMLVWVLAVAAGAALLLAGTNRLALAVASVRERSARRSVVTRAMGDLSDEIVVAAGVVLPDGRPVPELVIGPFGVAIVRELDGRDRLRQVGQGWETRTRDGWVPAEGPLEGVARDAERVRHWLVNGDLDYVVRVYAALVTTDAAIPRSPLCAVINEDQIPAWLAALPRQRSFSAGRRNHLLSRVRAAGAPGGEASRRIR